MVVVKTAEPEAPSVLFPVTVHEVPLPGMVTPVGVGVPKVPAALVVTATVPARQSEGLAGLKVAGALTVIFWAALGQPFNV